jgi:hypothetical protein
MRRISLVVIAALGTVSLPLTAAYADPSPAATIPVPAATPGQVVCTVDGQLSALVGITATASGYAVVDKANENNLSKRIYPLNSKCQHTTPINYGGTADDPRDIEVSADGSTYWVADSGDDLQSPTRDTIALWKIATSGNSKGTLYRFVFPNGDGPYDADALLMSGSTPIFVTHPLTGPSGIYVPNGTPSTSANVPLKKVGQFTPQKTGTANKLNTTGQLAVTGGAVSPDGKRVVLRTYSDAYEWDVVGGDVVKAITTTTPRITPLPNEDGGEAITYSHDGKYFLTVNDTNAKATILRYTPSAAIVPAKATGAAPGAPKDGGGQSWFSKLTLNQLVAIVATVGVIGLIMVAAGMIGISRARKRRPASATAGRGGRPGDEQWDDEDQPVPASARASASGVYQRDPDRYGGPGGHPPDADYVNAPTGRPDRPAQRGRVAPPPPAGGGVYGGGRGSERGDSGAVYGAGRDRGRDGGQGTGRARDAGPGADRGRGSGRDGGVYGGGRGGDQQGGGSSGGNYSSSGGYQPPASAPSSPPPVAPPVPPRTDGGIARSHRPGRSARGSAPPPRRGGYAEEHDGFDDLRRLSE